MCLSIFIVVLGYFMFLDARALNPKVPGKRIATEAICLLSIYAAFLTAVILIYKILEMKVGN